MNGGGQGARIHVHLPRADAGRRMPRFRNQPVDVVLDVRTRLEYWLGHLPGAECVPVQRVAAVMAARPEVAKDARILVYCASGARSAAAAATLRQLRYTAVVDGGGMSAAAAHYAAD